MKINFKFLFRLILSIIIAIGLFYGFLWTSMLTDLKNQKWEKAYSKSQSLCQYGLGTKKLFCSINESVELLINSKNSGKIAITDFAEKLPSILTITNFGQNFLSSPIARIFFNKNWQEIKSFREILTRINIYSEKIERLSPQLPKLLGENSETNYTIILQNNMELRATGGFMGSYIQTDVNKAKLENFSLQDIYVPDGQLSVHVNPPDPIGEAFKHGFWKLRDANWNPDFTFAAEKQIAWFLENGKEKVGTNIVALNLSLAEKIIKIIGPINLPEYGEINAQNFYAIAQHEAEVGFFPGSTQKKDFLSTAANHIILRANNLSPQKYGEILVKILDGLEQKELQIFSFDPEIQAIMEVNNWTGKVKWKQGKDYQLIIESNLGANKANCCVVKIVSQKVVETDNTFEVTLKINWENNSPVERPKPPKYWGGDYRNFVRIYLPQEVKVGKIKVNDQILKVDEVAKEYLNEAKLKEYGFWANVPHLSKTEVEINYILDKRENNSYSLTIQKQSGAMPFWQEVELQKEGKIWKTNKLIDRDMVIRF